MSPAPPIEDQDPPHVTVAAPGVLARFLEQLRDRAWAAGLVERAAAEMTTRAVHVDECRIEYCKVKPNRDVNVALVARLRGLSEGGDDTRRCSGTVFCDDAQGRAKYASETQRPIPEALRRRLHASGFTRSTALLSEPAMIVRAFPVDPLLPGLAEATDLQQMTPLLAQHLGDGPIRSIEHEILHYKPCRSCMVHYRISLGTPDAPQARRVYGKVYRDDHGEAGDRILRAAWEASGAGAAFPQTGTRRTAFRMARPVAYVAPWRLLLQEAVPGRDFRHVFAELTHDAAGAAELGRAEQLLEAIAFAIRSVQSMPLRLGPCNSFERMFAGQEHNLAYLKLSQPALAEQIEGIRCELARLEPRSAAAPLAFCHGDFAHGNVIIDDGAVGIVDLDKAGTAEPAYDVAYFLTHMWSFGVRHPRRKAHVARLSRHFREAYLARAPEVSSQRLALYEALDFAAYVLRNFRKQSHQADWMLWAQGQVEAAWERLDEAGAGALR